MLLLDDAQDEPATLAIAVALPERRGVQEALARAWAAAVPTAGYEIAWDCVVLDVRACAEEWDEALALLRCALASNTRPTPDVADASTDGLDVVLDPLRARPLASGVRVVAVLSAKGDLAGRRSDLWPLLDALPPDVNSPREVVAAPRWSGAAGGEREVTLAYAFEGPGGDLPGAETHLLLLHLLGHRAGLVRRLCDGEVSVGLEAGITRSVWTLRVACTAGELANVAATLEQALNQAHAPSPADLQRARALLVAQAARSAKAPAGRDRARRLARAALSEGVGPPVDLDDAAENRPLAQRRIRPFARVVLADGSAFRWDP